MKSLGMSSPLPVSATSTTTVGSSVAKSTGKRGSPASEPKLVMVVPLASLAVTVTTPPRYQPLIWGELTTAAKWSSGPVMVKLPSEPSLMLASARSTARTRYSSPGGSPAVGQVNVPRSWTRLVAPGMFVQLVPPSVEYWSLMRSLPIQPLP